MSSSNFDSMLATCQRLLKDYAGLLIRHRYLSGQLTSVQKKLLDSAPRWRGESESHEGLEKQEEQLKGVEQRLKALADDPYLDELLSVAKNKQQAEEIERYIQNWGIGRSVEPFDSPAHCIVWHANEHGGGEFLKYLRQANSFNKRGAKKKLVDGAKRWTRKSGEFLIERDGKIVSYGKNVLRFRQIRGAS